MAANIPDVIVGIVNNNRAYFHSQFAWAANEALDNGVDILETQGFRKAVDYFAKYSFDEEVLYQTLDKILLEFDIVW